MAEAKGSARTNWGEKRETSSSELFSKQGLGGEENGFHKKNMKTRTKYREDTGDKGVGWGEGERGVYCGREETCLRRGPGMEKTLNRPERGRLKRVREVVKRKTKNSREGISEFGNESGGGEEEGKSRGQIDL